MPIATRHTRLPCLALPELALESYLDSLLRDIDDAKHAQSMFEPDTAIEGYLDDNTKDSTGDDDALSSNFDEPFQALVFAVDGVRFAASLTDLERIVTCDDALT